MKVYVGAQISPDLSAEFCGYWWIAIPRALRYAMAIIEAHPEQQVFLKSIHGHGITENDKPPVDRIIWDAHFTRQISERS